ncbi:MAG: hypothetical protein CMH54_06545 [Myxococcales bacterium]|nr:hypothetical protein [Myxococcales bacterium]
MTFSEKIIPRDRPVSWLEISADYSCNNRCIGCYSVLDTNDGMDTREAFEVLQMGRRRGARNLWMGGGEPTLRRDLTKILAQARRLGYERIKLQTNGMLLAYPAYLNKCVEAGLTEINFAIKGVNAQSHDRLTRTPGCFDLMVKGMEEAARADLFMEGDILVYRSNMDEIPEMIRFYTDLGLSRYNLWLFSATDAGNKDLTRQVPRISEVMPFIMEAMDLGLSDRPDFISSLHTPPCTIPKSHRACQFHAADLDLLVANPNNYSFWLEESPIEGGHYFDRCRDCVEKPDCGGARIDYVRVHGDEEFQPTKP